MHRQKSNEDLATIVRSGKSRPLRKWSLILAGIALLGGGAWFYLTKDKEEEGKPEYITEPASLGRISLIVTAAGNLAPINQVIIGSELSGSIVEVNVDTNDTVKKNQQLAKLDTTKLSQQTERSRAALLVAKARVSQANATLEEAKAAFARQQELHELSGGKTPSRATMETSRATVSRARETVARPIWKARMPPWPEPRPKSAPSNVISKKRLSAHLSMGLCSPALPRSARPSPLRSPRPRFSPSLRI
jgi:HlyD family secretion protein